MSRLNKNNLVFSAILGLIALLSVPAALATDINTSPGPTAHLYQSDYSTVYPSGGYYDYYFISSDAATYVNSVALYSTHDTHDDAQVSCTGANSYAPDMTIQNASTGQTMGPTYSGGNHFTGCTTTYLDSNVQKTVFNFNNFMSVTPGDHIHIMFHTWGGGDGRAYGAAATPYIFAFDINSSAPPPQVISITSPAPGVSIGQLDFTTQNWVFSASGFIPSHLYDIWVCYGTTTGTNCSDYDYGGGASWGGPPAKYSLTHPPGWTATGGTDTIQMVKRETLPTGTWYARAFVIDETSPYGLIAASDEVTFTITAQTTLSPATAGPITEIWNNILTRAPFGYITLIYTDLTGLSVGSIPTGENIDPTGQIAAMPLFSNVRTIFGYIWWLMAALFVWRKFANQTQF